MSPAIVTKAARRTGRDTVRATALAVAGVLAGSGIEARWPFPADPGCLQITSVPGIRADITIETGGHATWEYRLPDGAVTGPDQIIAMTMELLAAGPPDYDDPPVERECLTLKGIAGRALHERGLRVQLKIIGQDDENFDVFPEIWVTNPARPGRGMVRADDDGVIRWECHLIGRGRVSPAEFAATISRILTSSRAAQRNMHQEVRLGMASSGPVRDGEAV